MGGIDTMRGEIWIDITEKSFRVISIPPPTPNDSSNLHTSRGSIPLVKSKGRTMFRNCSINSIS